MKITLRKRNSVTSITLFLFNIYGEYKSDYSIRLKSLIALMKSFDKSEASIRMGLSRMVKSNILINKKREGEVVYELTNKGLENIKLWNRGLTRFFRRYELRQKEWDAKWRLLTLIGFNKSNSDNEFLLDELEEGGLREVDNNVWIGPYDVEEKIITTLNEKDYNYFKLAGELESNISSDDLLNDVFKINKLRQKYINFIDELENKEEEEKKATEDNLLSILFNLGWDFYDIVTSDPALPTELLAEWEGDKAVGKMKRLRAKLYKRVVKYFKIIGE